MEPRDDWFDANGFDSNGFDANGFGSNDFDAFDDMDPFSDEDDIDVEAELERQEAEYFAEADADIVGRHAAFGDEEDEDDDDEADDVEFLDADDDPFGDSSAHDAAWAEATMQHARCPHCGTTWERIRDDGRVGCASCYSRFRASLVSVMSQVQSGAHHVGKTPRAAEKRRLRLEHLRRRRDNQLAVLRSRLSEAVGAERYEEAAKLRDKIKVVSSSIFSE